MYTSNFIANSDYLIGYLLKQYVLYNESDSRKIIYDLADTVVDTEEVICEYPLINSHVRNIGKFPLATMLPLINNLRFSRCPDSINRGELFHKSTKLDYIDLEATNYMIIAKPGIETYELAEKMEQKFRCVHINCDRLIEREIKSKSRLGIWLDKNLQLNKILPIEIILWMIKRETRTEKVLYRGYILTGLPLIPNVDLNEKRKFLTEEDFLVFQQIVNEIIDAPITYRARELENLKRKLFTEYLNPDVETEEKTDEVGEETQTVPGLQPLPKLFHQLTCDRDVRFSINRQLFFALDLKSKPTILIYIDCDDDDIITKNTLFNKKTPIELDRIRIALKRYDLALDILQQFICHFPQCNVITCHGVYTIDEMFDCCSSKIIDTCCYRHVFMPIDFYETFKNDQSIIEKLEATTDPHDILTILCKINPVREDICWCRSLYETKCPAMATWGKCVLGKYQHSVQFFGYISLFSSDENKRMCLENPQSFAAPSPTCRVCVMGPRYSGKSTFARCLSKFFENCVIIDVNYLFEYYRKMEVRDMYYSDACKLAIETLSAERFDHYTGELKKREKQIHHWIIEMTHNINEFLKRVPMKKGKSKKMVPDKKALKKKEHLQILLNGFGFETDSRSTLKSYLSSKNQFLNRLPRELCRPILFREPEASDSDVQKIATEHMNELGKDYCIPFARKLEILVTKIRLCEKRQKILTKHKKLYGYWILDGLPPDIELVKGLHEMDCLPDVVVYIDDSVGERLAENQTIKCHREFYDTNYVMSTVINTNKKFFKRLVTNIPKQNPKEIIKSFEKQLVRRELDHVLMQESLLGPKDLQEENEKYRGDFETVKSFLAPTFTYLVSVDIHNKNWSETIITGLKEYFNYFDAYPHVLEEDWFKDETKLKDTFLQMGTTAEYCPVLFLDKMLLKLGLNQYAVQLKNKTYLMSTQEALEKFVKDPFKYSEIDRPFQIPPYRLCVIGNYHISKRSDLRRVADILGIKHVALQIAINMYLAITAPSRNFNISNFSEIFEELGDKLMTDIVAPLFKEGFIFEGFPHSAEHLQQMISLGLCPEQIFYLKIENKHLIRDEHKYYMQQYQEVLLKKILEYASQNDDWISQRKSRFSELMDSLPNGVSGEEEQERKENYVDRLEPDVLANILSDFDVQPDPNQKRQLKQLIVADMVNEEMPADRYINLIDELVKFPIIREVKDFMKLRIAEYDKIRLVAEENYIPFIQIRLHPYTTKEIEKSILKHVKESTDRQYIFDRAHRISYQNAVDYLYHGQFMLSRYFCTCPVRNNEMQFPIKLSQFFPDFDKQVQPFIHNEHIYFVQRLNAYNFATRPYLYTNAWNTSQISNTFRLVVHGPRNVGCNTLCERISKEFQINIFTLNGMKNFVRKNFNWTKLAKELFQNNMKITENQQICDLVKIATNFQTQGWLLRDLTLSAELLECFILNDMDINLVVFLDPTGSDMWTNFKNKYNSQKYKRKVEVIEKLYDMVADIKQFASRCSNFVGINQNVITITDFTSRWITWNIAYREILLMFRLFNLYKLRVIQLVATSLYKMNVTDYELNFRLSSLKLYCPLCWILNKLLIKYRYHYIDDDEAESFYTDNLYEKNLFQYLKHFYWACNNHMVELMVNAESYLPTESTLPNELPKLIKDWKDYVVTNQGYCPVAYIESDNTNVVIGVPEYAVLYFNKIYVMSRESYCLKFLQNPNKYKDTTIVFLYSNLTMGDDDFKDMKLDFGSVTATLITNALLECSFERPKHYGLDPGESLQTYLGLYFKCHNSQSSDVKINVYKSMFLKFWEECKLVQRSINMMQISGNPYIRRTKKPRGNQGSSTSTAFQF